MFISGRFLPVVTGSKQPEAASGKTTTSSSLSCSSDGAASWLAPNYFTRTVPHAETPRAICQRETGTTAPRS
jgi:hypothetical protein